MAILRQKFNCTTRSWQTITWACLYNPKFRVIPCSFLTRKWIRLPANGYLQESPFLLADRRHPGPESAHLWSGLWTKFRASFWNGGQRGLPNATEVVQHPQLITPSSQICKRGTRFMQKEWDSPLAYGGFLSLILNIMFLLPLLSSCFNPSCLFPLLK